MLTKHELLREKKIKLVLNYFSKKFAKFWIYLTIALKLIFASFYSCRTPEQCPSVVSLLAESYNPHVRYGAAMALGIACAGTGLREAIALLEPMIMFDPVNFVRQGALIASAMILIQQTEQTCPKVTFFRQSYAQVITNKHEDVMAKYGAILAQGECTFLRFVKLKLPFFTRLIRFRLYFQASSTPEDATWPYPYSRARGIQICWP